MPCKSMSKDFAAQRIRNLSFLSALRNALFPPHEGKELKTLIRTFAYPHHGPGQMWESVQAQAEAGGAKVLLGKKVTRVRHRDGAITAYRRKAARSSKVSTSIPRCRCAT